MGADAVAVAGGAEIYALALPQVQSIFLTQVHAAPEGDAVFPDFDRSQFREMRREDHPARARMTSIRLPLLILKGAAEPVPG